MASSMLSPHSDRRGPSVDELRERLMQPQQTRPCQEPERIQHHHHDDDDRLIVHNHPIKKKQQEDDCYETNHEEEHWPARLYRFLDTATMSTASTTGTPSLPHHQEEEELHSTTSNIINSSGSALVVVDASSTSHDKTTQDESSSAHNSSSLALLVTPPALLPRVPSTVACRKVSVRRLQKRRSRGARRPQKVPSSHDSLAEILDQEDGRGEESDSLLLDRLAQTPATQQKGRGGRRGRRSGGSRRKRSGGQAKNDLASIVSPEQHVPTPEHLPVVEKTPHNVLPSSTAQQHVPPSPRQALLQRAKNRISSSLKKQAAVPQKSIASSLCRTPAVAHDHLRVQQQDGATDPTSFHQSAQALQKTLQEQQQEAQVLRQQVQELKEEMEVIKKHAIVTPRQQETPTRKNTATTTPVVANPQPSTCSSPENTALARLRESKSALSEATPSHAPSTQHEEDHVDAAFECVPSVHHQIATLAVEQRASCSLSSLKDCEPDPSDHHLLAVESEIADLKVALLAQNGDGHSEQRDRLWRMQANVLRGKSRSHQELNKGTDSLRKHLYAVHKEKERQTAAIDEQGYCDPYSEKAEAPLPRWARDPYHDGYSDDGRSRQENNPRGAPMEASLSSWDSGRWRGANNQNEDVRDLLRELQKMKENVSDPSDRASFAFSNIVIPSPSNMRHDDCTVDILRQRLGR